MHGVFEKRLSEAREIERRLLRGDARLCGYPFGIAWKALFPFKSADELAARADCSKRAAEYQLTGEHKLTAESLKALIDVIMGGVDA